MHKTTNVLEISTNYFQVAIRKLIPLQQVVEFTIDLQDRHISYAVSCIFF